MSASDQSDVVAILLLVVGAAIVLPLLTMGVGFGGTMGNGGMMGQYGSGGGWWSFVRMLIPLGFLAVLLGGGYRVLQRRSDAQSSHTPAMEELRLAYARGDVTEEEFETRREKLEKSE